MSKAWSDKSEWITSCPICYCAVTHQLRDYHIQYHEDQIAISEVGKKETCCQQRWQMRLENNE